MKGTNKAHENGEARGLVGVRLTVMLGHGYWLWIMKFVCKPAWRHVRVCKQRNFQLFSVPWPMIRDNECAQMIGQRVVRSDNPSSNLLLIFFELTKVNIRTLRPSMRYFSAQTNEIIYGCFATGPEGGNVRNIEKSFEDGL